MFAALDPFKDFSDLVLRKLFNNLIAHQSFLWSSTSTHDSRELDHLPSERDYPKLSACDCIESNLCSNFDISSNQGVFESKIESIQELLVFWGDQIKQPLSLSWALKRPLPCSPLLLHFVKSNERRSTNIVLSKILHAILGVLQTLHHDELKLPTGCRYCDIVFGIDTSLVSEAPIDPGERSTFLSTEKLCQHLVLLSRILLRAAHVMLSLLELSQFLFCICKIIFTIAIGSFKILKFFLDVFILSIVLVEFSFGLLQLFILKFKSLFILTNLCLDTACFALNGIDFKLQIINLCFQLG